MGIQDIFKNLDKEERQENERELDYRENCSIREINKCWIEFYERVKETHKYDYEKISNLAYDIVGNYKSEDITLWSTGFNVKARDEDLQGISGLFASSLLNKSVNMRFELHIGDWSVIPNVIGYKLKNGRELVIYGDCGDVTGWYNWGNVIIKGNCGMDAFPYNRGSIVIEGDCGDYAGYKNRGLIDIRGNCGDNAGFGNKGIIKIGGNIDTMPEYTFEGKFYHKGKLIVDNGTRI